jgi:hypothetical protein
MVDTSLFNNFEPINLEELNKRAPLMVRCDKKYLLNTLQLHEFLQSIEADFQLLNIDGRHQFHYLSQYLDTPELQSFQDHNQGKRNRFKLRFRQYIDSNLYYLELKLKGRRNLTHKYRIPIQEDNFSRGSLTNDMLDFVNNKLFAHYKRRLNVNIQKNLLVEYIRTTLVSKRGSERITIDNQLNFSGAEKNYPAAQGLWIVEVKSKSGHSSVDKQLFQQKIRPTPRCSKYCVGLSLTQGSKSNNRFRAVVRKFMNGSFQPIAVSDTCEKSQ